MERQDSKKPVKEKSRGHTMYVLPPIEIRVPKNTAFYEYEVASGEGSTEFEICVVFEAEDGIRDYKVTGVQTCALPISASSIPHTTTPPAWPSRPGSAIP